MIENGRPFGFTREDVMALRLVLEEADLTDKGPPGGGYMSDERSEIVGRLHALADRIATMPIRTILQPDAIGSRINAMDCGPAQGPGPGRRGPPERNGTRVGGIAGG